MTSVSLLVPITSRKCNFNSLESTPLFNVFLPNLAETLEDGFEYCLYLGIDDDDPFFESRVSKIKNLFENRYSFSIQINLFSNTQHSPVSVWNRLFEIAYDDGSDFFYQLGDDIEIKTGEWTSMFVDSLNDLSLVGMVGPREIYQSRIITQTFVHRKHYEIFNYYFPPEFDNWFSDDWINRVYESLGRRDWLKNVKVSNTTAEGPNAYTRYEPSQISDETLNKLVNRDTSKIKKYLKKK